MYSGSALALQGLSIGQLQVSAPGELNLKVPAARTTNVRFVLPDGSLLPGVTSSDNSPSSSIQGTDGVTWYVPIAQAVKSVSGVTTYKVYVSVGAGKSLEPTYDIDGDGFYDLSISFSTANGGYKRMFIPSSIFISGGDFQVTDASYLIFDQREVRGVAGSYFTLSGRAINVGKGVKGTFSRLWWLSSQTVLSSSVSLPADAVIANQQVINADGTFKFVFTIKPSHPYISANQQGALYGFSAEVLPVTVSTAKSSYKSCVALNQDYQGGVSGNIYKNKGVTPKFKSTVNDRLYKVVKALDVDKDGIACEK
jgi:hypothetical protein